MINLNGVEFPERYEKPAAGGRVGLRAFFYNDGQVVDPFDISAVSVFAYDDYASRSLFSTPGNLVDVEPLMQFGFNETETYPQNAAAYTATWAGGEDYDQASGIFKLATGDFIAPLRLDVGLSGAWETTELAADSVSAATTYIDVWTVKLLEGSNYQSFIHKWSLYEDTFFSITQPLLVKTSAKLSNKHLRYGEVIDLTFPVEVTIENKNIDESILNILKSTLITNPKVKIVKMNDDPALDGGTNGWVVLAFTDEQTINVTADGTIIYTWDTTTIPSSNTFGSAPGTYAIQVRYEVNTETIISPRFYVTVN
jgi:DNA-directed RNA polymerase subunit L|tara:strand:- start:216 stop:1148 length:933 start_codon:yes stop_codon:yes gene_type:complete